MSTTSTTSDTTDERARAWRVASRLSEFRGEERANLLRVVGVAVFYIVELINRHGLHLGPLDLPAVSGVDARFHAAMTGAALAWVLLSCSVLIGLRNRFFPPWLKYGTTAADLVLASIVLTIADGPQSPLVVIYFPLVALAVLRLSPQLVRFAASGAIVSYLGVVLANDLVLRHAPVPRYHSILLVLALALVGVVLDRALVEIRRVAAEYSAREPGGGA